MTNNPKKHSLFVTLRPFDGPTDGPQQIIKNLVDEGCMKDTVFFFAGKLIGLSDYKKTTHLKAACQSFMMLRLVMHLLFSGKTYKSIIVFGSFNWTLVLATILICGSRRVSVIGYDSITRTMALNYKRALTKNKLVWAARFSKYFLLELLFSILRVRFLFVSQFCVEYHKKLFSPVAPKAELLPTLPSDNKRPAREVLSNKVYILGPCNSDLDYHNLNQTLKLMLESGFTLGDLIFVGSGFHKFNKNEIYRINFVENFDKWAGNLRHPIVSLRPRAPGIQTKIQRMLLLGNCVFCIDEIDVFPISNHLVRPLRELKPNFNYKLGSIDEISCRTELSRVLPNLGS